MDRQASRLTVFFEDPFWVGVAERWSEGRYEAAKVTFGAEPSDPQLYQWVLQEWNRLRFRPAEAETNLDLRRINPKRAQRTIRKEVRPQGMGTKAQELLKRQYEQEKADHAALRRQEQLEETERRFQLRQARKKEKHRGH